LKKKTSFENIIFFPNIIYKNKYFFGEEDYFFKINKKFLNYENKKKQKKSSINQKN